MQPIHGIGIEGWKPTPQRYEEVRVSEVADPLDRTKRAGVWPGPVYAEGGTLIEVIENLARTFAECKAEYDTGQQVWFPRYRSACNDAGRLVAFYGPNIVAALKEQETLPCGITTGSGG